MNANDRMICCKLRDIENYQKEKEEAVQDSNDFLTMADLTIRLLEGEIEGLHAANRKEGEEGEEGEDPTDDPRVVCDL